MLRHIRLVHLLFPILPDSLPFIDSSCDCLTDTALCGNLDRGGVLPHVISTFLRSSSVKALTLITLFSHFYPRLSKNNAEKVENLFCI